MYLFNFLDLLLEIRSLTYLSIKNFCNIISRAGTAKFFTKFTPRLFTPRSALLYIVNFKWHHSYITGRRICACCCKDFPSPHYPRRAKATTQLFSHPPNLPEDGIYSLLPGQTSANTILLECFCTVDICSLVWGTATQTHCADAGWPHRAVGRLYGC